MTIHAKLRKLTLNDNLLAGPTNSHGTADGCLATRLLSPQWREQIA